MENSSKEPDLVQFPYILPPLLLLILFLKSELFYWLT